MTKLSSKCISQWEGTQAVSNPTDPAFSMLAWIKNSYSTHINHSFGYILSLFIIIYRHKTCNSFSTFSLTTDLIWWANYKQPCMHIAEQRAWKRMRNKYWNFWIIVSLAIPYSLFLPGKTQVSYCLEIRPYKSIWYKGISHLTSRICRDELDLLILKILNI